MKTPAEMLTAVLRQPSSLVTLSLAEWDRLLPWARSTDLLARIASYVQKSGVLDKMPLEVRWHLQAAAAACDRNQKAIRWEVRGMARALGSCNNPMILLKGAAYVQACLPPAAGRFCSDVDLLVERPHLARVEAALLQHGWQLAPIRPLDERYFRTTLHELPPLRHSNHPGELDVHHNLLPATDSLTVDATKLFDAAVPISQGSAFGMLAPCDMVLHAAAHLFRNGQFEHGLRDLLDLRDLVDHFRVADGFWDRLVARASELNLQVPCFWGLRYAERFLALTIPLPYRPVIDGWRPSWPPVSWMDPIVAKAVFPSLWGCDDRPRTLAHWLLAHYPTPRLSSMTSSVFWLKRLPWQSKAGAQPTR